MSVVPAPRTIFRLDVGTLLYPWVVVHLPCAVGGEKGWSQRGRGGEGLGGETKLWEGRGWSEEIDQMRGGWYGRKLRSRGG